MLLVAPAKLFEKGEGSIRLSGRIAGETIAGTGEAPAGGNDPLERQAHRRVHAGKETGRKPVAAR